MTPEQTQILTGLGDYLIGNESSYADLAADQQSLLLSLLMPTPGEGWTESQRYWIERWFLRCTDAEQDALRPLWPAHSMYPRRELDGAKYLSAGLLADAIGDGRLSAMWEILATLPLVKIDPEEWPQPDPEE